MGAYKPPAHRHFDPIFKPQRAKGTGSISGPRADGRWQVSVVRADGRGRRYALARSQPEAEQKLTGLVAVANGSSGLYEWADRFLALWAAAGPDEDQRRWVRKQFVKKWAELAR
jgi:hypothetical protein